MLSGALGIKKVLIRLDAAQVFRVDSQVQALCIVLCPQEHQATSYNQVKAQQHSQTAKVSIQVMSSI